MNKIRKSFPVVKQSLYANTAAIGLMSEELLEWRQEHDLDFLIGGSEMKMDSFHMISGVRDTLGKFLGCDRNRIALSPNFSLALNTVLEGLPKENNVLLLQSDYPSVNWPFESRDFNLTYAKIDDKVESHIEEKLQHGKIDVFAFSLVQWENGLMISRDFIKYIREQYPNLMMIADGTQYCGAFDLNFDDSGLDILGGSGYKWLLAGTGNGYMLFSERASERLSLKSIGFNSVNGNIEAKNDIRLAKRLEPGHLDSTCFGSLDFSIKKLMEWDIKNIEKHNKALIEKARESLLGLDLLEKAIAKRKNHGAILNIKGGDKLFSYLSDNNVCCSQRGGGIRLSFHLYNSESDVDTIVDILNSAPSSLSSYKN